MYEEYNVLANDSILNVNTLYNNDDSRAVATVLGALLQNFSGPYCIVWLWNKVCIKFIKHFNLLLITSIFLSILYYINSFWERYIFLFSINLGISNHLNLKISAITETKNIKFDLKLSAYNSFVILLHSYRWHEPPGSRGPFHTPCYGPERKPFAFTSQTFPFKCL